MLQSPGEFITYSQTSQENGALANLHFHMILALFDEILFLLLLCMHVHPLQQKGALLLHKAHKDCLAIQNGSVKKAHVWFLLNPEGSHLAKVDCSTKQWEPLGVRLKEHLVKHYCYKGLDATVYCSCWSAWCTNEAKLGKNSYSRYMIFHTHITCTVMCTICGDSALLYMLPESARLRDCGWEGRAWLGSKETFTMTSCAPSDSEEQGEGLTVTGVVSPRGSKL